MADARRNPPVRQAVIAASRLLTALVCVLPLRQIALDLGGLRGVIDSGGNGWIRLFTRDAAPCLSV